MFIATYIFILSLTSAVAAWAMTLASTRLPGLIGYAPRGSAGLFAFIAAVAFLMVVGAPGAVLAAAILLVLAAAYAGPRFYHFRRWGVPFLLVLFALSRVTFPAVAQVPPLALTALALLAWTGFTISGDYTSTDLRTASLGIGVTLLPLFAASFMFGAPSWIALDSLLILASLGGALSPRPNARETGVARGGLALILGWLILETALHGAWIPALISLVLWLGFLGYCVQTHSWRQNHAFDF